MTRRFFRDRKPLLLALFLGAMAFAGTCPTGHTRNNAMAPQAGPPKPAPTPAPDLFQSTVQPMLAATCSPCHVPGGKMYERLPFDRPEIVSSNVEGIRRRLKGENRQTLERWLAALPAPPR